MSNFNDALAKVKPCFGCFEDLNSSWHCKACPIRDECKTTMKTKEKENGNDK